MIEEFSKARLSKIEPITIKDKELTFSEIVEHIRPQLTDERIARIDEVISSRSLGLIPVFENPYDLGNISAVMRSAEAFGCLEFDLVISPGARFKAANRVARGADKWLDVQITKSPAECVQNLRDRGYKIFATHLESAIPIDEIDFSKPTAIILGNEKDGVSNDMLDLVDGRFKIPMYGFSQSFNISVAAALVFFQARKFKLPPLTDAEKLMVLANYYLRSR